MLPNRQDFFFKEKEKDYDKVELFVFDG